MRTEGPLWRENAQKNPIFSEGLFECRTMVKGYCYNIAHKWICKWHRSALTESVSVDMFVMYGQVRGSMVWILAQDRLFHCDAHCNITGRVTLHMCYNFLVNEEHSRVEESIRGGTWGGHFTSCIIQSYLLLGFFVWLRFFSCHTCTHVKVRQLWV